MRGSTSPHGVSQPSSGGLSGACAGSLPASRLYVCCMYVACLLHVCCMCVACVLHVCCMSVACALHVCCMSVACVLHVCCMCVACVLHVCRMSVACVLHVCCMRLLEYDRCMQVYPWSHRSSHDRYPYPSSIIASTFTIFRRGDWLRQLPSQESTDEKH